MRRVLAVIAVLLLAFNMTGPVFAAPALPVPATPVPAETGEQTIVLAGGCFWGIEAVYRHVKGVTRAVSGYAGGAAADATYDLVSTGKTAHAEAVQITYDPAQIGIGQLLQIFFAVAHDPTQIDRQGPDTGPQYRSEIFFTTPAQEQAARAYMDQLTAAKAFPRPLATRLSPLTVFYPAEDYHQNYAALNPNKPYIVIHDRPKVEKLKKTYPELYSSPVP